MPPSGTFTVVSMVIVVKAGCWKNIWKITGCRLALLPLPGPSKNGGTVICTGNSGTVGDARFVRVGVRFDADEAAVGRHHRRAPSWSTPSGNGWLLRHEEQLAVGLQPIWTSVRKNWLSLTVMVAVWPLNTRHLRRLHDVGAAIALGGFQEHEDLDVAEERQAQRQAAVGAERARVAAERRDREVEAAALERNVQVGRQRAAPASGRR